MVQPPPESGVPMPPPLPPHGRAAGPSSMPPAAPGGSVTAGAPPIVQVIDRGGGFWRGVAMIVTALAVLTGVFAVGVVVAVVSFVVAGLGLSETGVSMELYRKGGSRVVYIIPVEGVIDGRRSAFVHRCVERVLEDGNAQAVVLRVDSPGGGVTSSDQIWHEVGRLRDAGLPVVASYGGVSASGGYYASCASDYIMAEQTTITGSIGVIAQIMTFEGLMEKVGIEPVTLVSSGSPEKATANDLFRAWTDDDRAQVQRMIDAAYETFHARVADGRGGVITDPARLGAIADGSVYTAKQALSNGLIDGIGYLDDAIARAEQMAGARIGSSTARRFMRPPSLLDATPLAARRAPGDLLDAEAVRSFVNDLGRVRVLYLMH